MPAVSQAQRAYLNAHFGHSWVKEHHFDNPGPLPEHVNRSHSMSSMMFGGGAQGPAPSIQIPAGGSAQPGGAAGGGKDSTYQHLIDSTNDPETLVEWARQAIQKAIQVEPDHEDKLLLEKLTTSAQQYLAQQQKMGDQAIGAGPGAKLVRKVTQSAAQQGGSY